jgi:membrane-bound inhibitor of C-type lysozyme
VHIFVRKDTHVNKIDISYNCKEKDLEICAVQFETEASQTYYAYTEPPLEILIDLLKLWMIF